MKFRTITYVGAVFSGMSVLYGTPFLIASCGTVAEVPDLASEPAETVEAPFARLGEGRVAKRDEASPQAAGEGVLGAFRDGGKMEGFGGLEGGSGRQIGSGGLGARGAGLGGGGIADGLGGLGTKGIGAGSSGYGSGGGHFVTKGGGSVGFHYGGQNTRPNPLMKPGAQSDRGSFTDHGVNAVTLVSEDSQSTFAADVDTASYTVSRSYINRRQLPPAAAVRVEEFVNYFPYPKPNPSNGQVFAVKAESAPSPWTPHRSVLRIGVNTAVPDASNRKPMALTFLVDTSCSMGSANKLPLATRSLHHLVENLGPEDSVAIATYAGHSRVELPPTSMTRPEPIYAALNQLRAEGSTAMGAGIDMAYDLAHKALRRGVENRVIILSDGDANVGAQSHGELLKLIKDYAGKGITLSTIGFGQGIYRDTLMEQLANKGDGNSYYIDSEREARRIFGSQILSTLQTVARDVKLQVNFNEDAVISYRLVGYENRAVADQDFRNDEVDAGEIGPGHSVTALYEVILQDDPKGPLGTVNIRHKKPGPDVPATEVAYTIPQSVMRSEWAEASRSYRIALGAATFAEILRGSPHVNEIRFSDVEKMVRGAMRDDVAEDQELLSLIQMASHLNPVPPPTQPSHAVSVAAQPIILGALDRTLIDGVISRHAKAIRYCYQKELTKSPHLAGRIFLKFVVARDGTVSSSNVRRRMTTLQNAKVQDCVANRIKRLQFPKPKGGGIVIVSYPFEFYTT